MNPDIEKFPVPDANLAPTGTPNVENDISSQLLEHMPSREIRNVAPAQPVVSAMPAIVSNPTVPATQQLASAGSDAVASLPLPNGADEDLKRKWVAIAKTIVERTKGDPYSQSQQLSRAGREYRAQTGRAINSGDE